METKQQHLDEEYQVFVREWKCNHKTEVPSVSEWKRWFRITYKYK